MHEWKPHTAQLPYRGPPPQLRHPFFWHRSLMLNDNSSRVSGYITQGSRPFQHVDAQRVWLVALLTVSSGCQLTAGRSNCPTQPFSAQPPMSNDVSISNFWVLETFLSPSGNAFSNTLKLTHFDATFFWGGWGCQYNVNVWELSSLSVFVYFGLTCHKWLA